MPQDILTLNDGSSSLKVALYSATGGETPIVSGQIERIGTSPKLTLQWTNGSRVSRDTGAAGNTHVGALEVILSDIGLGRPGLDVAAVAHRIVHGGPDRDDSEVLHPGALETLERLAPYAPLHQPHNLTGIRAAMALFPDALQVGCFDTAFHRGHPWVNDTFALPRAYYDKGVRRYGFHGLSYDFIAGRLAETEPVLAQGRVIVLHLGNGASICGLRGGRSVASTMGFSALDGLPMGTRPGQIDPGVLLYLMSEEGMSADEISALLHNDSGLLGLSGISNDMRVLLGSGAPEAAQAVEYFVSRIQREIGSMAAALGGVDGIVFTGGIGENAAPIRARVCAGMGWLGLEIDEEANAAGGPVISTPESAVRILAVRTDEEAVLAREARRHLAARRA